MFPGLDATFGAFGVYIFFAISGYLNAGSLLRGKSSTAFLYNRVLRIYPALLACTILSIVLGAMLTTVSLRQYAFDGTTAAYLLRNATLIAGVRYNLPGVFEANPYPQAVNGSLWTLPYEMDLYIALALVLLVWRYKSAALYALAAFSVVGLALLPMPSSSLLILPGVFADHLATFAALFLGGAFIAACERDFGFMRGCSACLAVGVLLFATGNVWLARLLIFSPLVIALGRLEPPRVLQPRIDISYGFYLYAFPMQQLAVLQTTRFWPVLIASALATLVMAYLSSRLVEQPALRLKIRSARPSAGRAGAGMALETAG
jgi:peptidoglycan/LPS O-acetylase OafA/YrhL